MIPSRDARGARREEKNKWRGRRGENGEAMWEGYKINTFSKHNLQPPHYFCRKKKFQRNPKKYNEDHQWNPRIHVSFKHAAAIAECYHFKSSSWTFMLILSFISELPVTNLIKHRHPWLQEVHVVHFQRRLHFTITWSESTFLSVSKRKIISHEIQLLINMRRSWPSRLRELCHNRAALIKSLHSCRRIVAADLWHYFRLLWLIPL